MLWKPGLERGGAVGFALAVDAAESVERTDEDEEVGDGDAEHHPVDGVEWPHGCGGARSRQLQLGVCWASADVVSCTLRWYKGNYGVEKVK